MLSSTRISCIAIIYEELLYKANLLKLHILQDNAVQIATGYLRSNTKNMYKCGEIVKFDYINTYLVENVCTRSIIR